ncbi:hypothetical protein P7841_10940, partial [Staphylococcus aureus]|nr:hypothetical protein [Staphylococcus aureus]
MTQFLGALLLTGVLGYIPYKYLTMIGLVSEKNKIINTPVLLIFSIETCLIWFYKSSPDSCVKCYTMFLPFLLIKIDVF